MRERSEKHWAASVEHERPNVAYTEVELERPELRASQALSLDDFKRYEELRCSELKKGPIRSYDGPRVDSNGSPVRYRHSI